MRPVLLGMNNPLSGDPEHALFPWPPNCTGWRVHQMLLTRVPGVTRGQYCAAFERANLLHTREWSREKARAGAARFLARSDLIGRVVLVFGVEPRRLLGLPPTLVHPIVRDGVTFRWLPHPSGRCRWYNDEKNRAIAALLLEELYLKSTGGWSDGTERAVDKLSRTSKSVSRRVQGQERKLSRSRPVRL